MLSDHRLTTIVEQHGVTLAGAVTPFEHDAGKFYVPIDLAGIPSSEFAEQERVEKNLVGALIDAGYDAELYFINTPVQRVENNLRSILVSSFSAEIREVTILRNGLSLIVELSVNETSYSPAAKRISDFIQKFLRLIGIKNFSIESSRNQELLTKIEILSTVRLLAPITTIELSSHLAGKGYKDSTPAIIARRLDSLRKEGLLIRTKRGRYALTFNALHRLGTVKTGRSPDVSRLLALARS